MSQFLTLTSASRLLTISTATFAGMNLGLSVVAVPAILDSNDPLPSWRTLYNRASKLAVASLFTSTTAGIYCFVSSGGGVANGGFLATAVLTFSIIPYTLIFMKPINDHLFGVNRNEEVKNVKEIVKKWERFHWVRTLTGIIAFGLQVFQGGQHQLTN